jgi:hypothetical protein
MRAESDSCQVGDRILPDAKVLTLSGEKVRPGVLDPFRSSSSDVTATRVTEGNPMEVAWSSILAFRLVPVVIEPILFLVFDSKDAGEASDVSSSA